MFKFGHCPNYLTPTPKFRHLAQLFVGHPAFFRDFRSKKRVQTIWTRITVNPQIYIFHIYTRPKLTGPTFTQNPELHKPKFTQLRFIKTTSHDSNLHKTEPKFTHTQIGSNLKVKEPEATL